LFEADTLVINEIPLHNLSYKCIAGENNLINNIFGFSSNSHFYKMHIEFPSSKKEKGEKEMSKIISSLNIHCK